MAMSANKTRRLLLAGLGAGVVVVGALLYHHTVQRDTQSLEIAVTVGLQRLYKNLVSEHAGGTNFSTFKAVDLSSALEREAARPKFLPSFVRATDISVSAVDVARGTTNLLCVVYPQQTAKYGLDGAGGYRKVSDPEYANWPHSALNVDAGQAAH